MEVSLNKNMGYKWKKNNGLAIKGQIVDTFPLDIMAQGDINFAISKVLDENKQFASWVYETEHNIFASVDHMRMFPLFYGNKNNKVYLSDDASWIKRKVSGDNYDKKSSVEFLMTGYVTGRDTLYKEVRQLQAGEYLIYNKEDNSVEIREYYDFNNSTFLNQTNESLIEKLNEIHQFVFKRLIKFLNGRIAVLPLSGGYDSRIIALMLKRLGYDNVFCFTYGKPGNLEAEISEEVARNLNYKWVLIPYSKNKWEKWFNSKEKKEYFDFAGEFTSIAHIQDYIAVKELKSKGVIPKDAVFIPGHTSALSFSGYNSSNKSIEHVVENIIKKHYSLWSWKYKDNLKFRGDLELKLYKDIEKSFSGSESLENVFYKWETKERHSKFICNSVRAYEFLGFEWALPLWEKEMVDFWLKVPQELRVKKTIYKEFVDSEFGKVNIQNSLIGEKSQVVKNLILKNPLLYDTSVRAKRILEYFNHPLEWYGVINFDEHIFNILKGATDINSVLTKSKLYGND